MSNNEELLRQCIASGQVSASQIEAHRQAGDLSDERSSGVTTQSPSVIKLEPLAVAYGEIPTDDNWIGVPEALGFTIENRASVDVLVWKDGGCQPATSAEVAMWKALAVKQQAAPKAAPGESLTRDQIREVFMAHGFTIKDGQTDLKQYVYDAAYALLALAAPPTAPAVAAPDPVAYLYDDGSWTPAKTEEGRKLSNWMISAGSPKIGVLLASAAQPTRAVQATQTGNQREAQEPDAFSLACEVLRIYGGGPHTVTCNLDIAKPKSLAGLKFLESALLYAWRLGAKASPQQEPLTRDTLYLLRRLLSNQHTLTGQEFRAELEKIVGEAYQQEAQEPVVAAVFDEQLGRPVLIEGAPLLRHGQELYTAPQPAPLSDDVVKDAMRYKALRDGSIEHDDILETIKEPGKWQEPYAVLLRGVALDSAIDEALATKGCTK